MQSKVNLSHPRFNNLVFMRFNDLILVTLEFLPLENHIYSLYRQTQV